MSTNGSSWRPSSSWSRLYLPWRRYKSSLCGLGVPSQSVYQIRLLAVAFGPATPATDNALRRLVHDVGVLGMRLHGTAETEKSQSRRSRRHVRQTLRAS